MNKVMLAKGVYAVGAVDWKVRSFHGYSTARGSSYNAYLIVDEKIALIDTVKAPFADELLKRISAVVDPARLDYIISNHVELDHTGALPAVLAAAPNAKIITSDPNGMKGLTAHFGRLDYTAVKAGDSISLGMYTLEFLPIPMVHWPDSMATYCPELRILFSNDAFGQHYATNRRFDDENDSAEIMQEAAKYYANIVLPYGAQVKKALEACAKLNIGMIAPSHGVVWRSGIADILKKYREWSAGEAQEKAVVVYDSMYGSTEKMALAIAEAFAQKGVPAKVCDLKAEHISDVMTGVLSAKYICVGSPTLNNGVLPTVAAFLSYMKGLAPKNKLGVAFGSYGWGGQSAGIIEDALKETGFTLMQDKLRAQWIPAEDKLEEITQLVMRGIEANG